MVIELSIAFTIFFLTLGPIKTVPGYAIITADLDGAACRWLAFRSALLATVIVFVTALIFQGMMKSWRVSGPAMQIAGGILLFISASQAVAGGLGSGPPPVTSAPAPPSPLDAEAKARAFSPLAVPTIVTPVGIAAILVFGDAAAGDQKLLLEIYGVLALIMALNLLGMLFARPILKLVGVPAFRLAGWIMSVLQAGLAVQFILAALRVLKIAPTT